MRSAEIQTKDIDTGPSTLKRASAFWPAFTKGAMVMAPDRTTFPASNCAP